MHLFRPLIKAALVAAGVTHVATADAAVIFSESFESPSPATTGNPLDTPAGWTFPVNGRPDLTGLYSATTPYGAQVFQGYAGGGGWDMNTTASILNHTIASGEQYTLTFNYGSRRSDRAGNFTAELVSIDGGNNITVLASDSRSWLAGHGYSVASETFSLSHTAASNDGERLAIRIRHQTAATAYASFDNLELDVVPEPSTALLCGLGTLLLLRRRRCA